MDTENRKKAERRKKDVNITLHHIMDFGDRDFEIKILNTGSIVHNMKEFVIEAGRLTRGGVAY